MRGADRWAIFGWLLLLLRFAVGAASAAAATQGDANLLVAERGVKVVSFSSEFGGWDAANMLPSLARLAEPGVTLEDFVWCTADDAPFPHWILFELAEPQWLTTFIFNNALKEEAAYPGISARDLEIWAGNEAPDSLRKVAAFRLERNKNGQSVQIEPLQARWIKFVITGNWGHPTWTELNATAAYDDGSRPADLAAALEAQGKVDLYGIYFDFNSAELRPESGPVLEEILAYHRANPQRMLVIEGHTDNRGGSDYNLGLSRRRAAAVVEALSRMGGQTARFDALGLGESQPVANNQSAQGRARNRRVTLRLMP
jgi:outer membrane protein OmpA-like peptidoglycan-associated protein